MSEQREKPAPTKEEVEARLGVEPSPNNYVSGGQFQNFREGWAKFIMGNGNKAHYFRRNRFDNAVALCGTWAPVRWIYGPGNFPRCKRCEQLNPEKKA